MPTILNPRTAVASVADHERSKVHRNLGTAAQYSHTPHAAELMHAGKPGDQALVADCAISGTAAVRHHHHSVADRAVMGNMRVRHHEAAAADRGHGSLMSPAVHRDPLAKPVVVPDFRIGNPALETVILRIGPDGSAKG